MISSRPLPKPQSNSKVIQELFRFLWIRNRAMIGILLAIQIPGRYIEYELTNGIYMSNPNQIALNVLEGSIGLLFCILLPILIARLANGDSPNSMEGDKGNGSAYPPYMLTLPVPDNLLVWVPMVFGVAAVSAILGLTALLHFGADRHTYSSWMLNLACLTICLQAITWSRLRGQWTKPLLGAAAIVTAVFSSLLTNSIPKGNLHFMTLGIAIVAIGIAAASFSRLRHGFPESMFVIKIRPELRRSAHLKRPFQSPMQTQFALDWTRQGKIQPIITVLLVTLMIGFTLYERSVGNRYPLDSDAALTLVLLFGVVVVCVGSTPRRTDIYRPDQTVQPFLATRPISSTQFIWSKLRVSAISTLLTWATIAALFAFWMFGTTQAGAPSLKIANLTFTTDSTPAILFVLTGLFSGLVLLWNAQTALLTTEVSGKKWATLLLLSLAVLTASLVLFNQQVPDRDRWLPILAGIAIGSKLILAGSSAAKLMKQGEIHWQDLIKIGGAWSVITGLLVTGFLLSSPTPTTPADRFLVTECIVLLVPLARIFAAPLSLAMNRHQSSDYHAPTKGKRTTTAVY